MIVRARPALPQARTVLIQSHADTAIVLRVVVRRQAQPGLPLLAVASQIAKSVAVQLGIEALARQAENFRC